MNGNYSTLTTLINDTINTKIDSNYDNLLTAINNNDATINAVYTDTLNRISSLSYIKQDVITEAPLNTIVKNDKVKWFQGTGVISVSDINNEILQISANLFQYDSAAAATQGKKR